MRWGETAEWERAMQPHMDEVYEAWGFDVDRSSSCKQYDVILKKGDKVLRIEEKFLFTEDAYDQMLVELIQNVADSRGNLGWFYHVDADYLIWTYCPSDHETKPYDFWVIDFPQLKGALLRRLGQQKSQWERVNYYSQTPDHITLNVPVRYSDLGDAATYRQLRQRPSATDQRGLF